MDRRKLLLGFPLLAVRPAFGQDEAASPCEARGWLGAAEARRRYSFSRRGEADDEPFHVRDEIAFDFDFADIVIGESIVYGPGSDDRETSVRIEAKPTLFLNEIEQRALLESDEDYRGPVRISVRFASADGQFRQDIHARGHLVFDWAEYEWSVDLVSVDERGASVLDLMQHSDVVEFAWSGAMLAASRDVRFVLDQDEIAAFVERTDTGLHRDAACETEDDCFLTTACCQAMGRPDDGFELRTLRRLRDGWLAARPFGASAIARYDVLGPAVRAGRPVPDYPWFWLFVYAVLVLPTVAFAKAGAPRAAFAWYERLASIIAATLTEGKKKPNRERSG